MKLTWFSSPYRIMTIPIILCALTMLALMIMLTSQGISERTVAASLLVLSFVIFCVAGTLFTGRALWKWDIKNLSTFILWERSLVIVPTVTASLGLALLSDMLNASGHVFWARLGATAYLFGAVLVVAAETSFLRQGEWNAIQIVLYVVLALLGQAAIGVALTQSGLVAKWVGWGTLIWNMSFLIVFIVVRPRDVYYPVIHFFALLVIGLGLLAGK